MEELLFVELMVHDIIQNKQSIIIIINEKRIFIYFLRTWWWDNNRYNSINFLPTISRGTSYWNTVCPACPQTNFSQINGVKTLKKLWINNDSKLDGTYALAEVKIGNIWCVSAASQKFSLSSCSLFSTSLNWITNSKLPPLLEKLLKLFGGRSAAAAAATGEGGVGLIWLLLLVLLLLLLFN